MIDFKNGALFKLSPIDTAQGHKTVEQMLVDGEKVVAAFKTIRDKVIVTDKRIITVNVQGVTGKKTDYTSLPFSKVQAFSVETAGVFDMDAEIDLWFSGLGNVRLEIKGNFDIRSFNQILSKYIL